jgi:hypothetical protein
MAADSAAEQQHGPVAQAGAELVGPIETGRLYRAGETVVLGAAALTANVSGLDTLSGGHATDAIGTAAGISLLTTLYRKGDPRGLAIGAALAVNSAVEIAQGHHLLERTPLDGIYDVRDFAAFTAGALLSVGIDSLRKIIQRGHATT